LARADLRDSDSFFANKMESDGEQSLVLFVSLPRQGIGYSGARPTAQGANSW
jgi:hypothetical protein